MKATMFRVEPELHKWLSIAVIETGMPMNEAVKQAVKTWLQKPRKGGKAR
jgi:hypothetical protein